MKIRNRSWVWLLGAVSALLGSCDDGGPAMIPTASRDGFSVDGTRASGKGEASEELGDPGSSAEEETLGGIWTGGPGVPADEATSGEQELTGPVAPPLSVALQTLSFSGLRALAAGDLDGDGSPDIVAGADGRIRIWHNDGEKGFRVVEGDLDGGPIRALALGDVDLDGDLDLVEGNYAEAVVVGFDRKVPDRVLLNDGGGGFADSGQRIGATLTRALVLGDLDGDLDLDLVSANDGGNRVYLNDGAGRYAYNGQSFYEVRTSSVALGDLDGDGDLDIVTGNTGLTLGTGPLGGQPDRVFLNDSRGRFELFQLIGDVETSAVLLADLDADPGPELVRAHAVGADVRGGLGGGRFATSGPQLSETPSFALAAGDVDLDGDVDLLVSGADGVFVWESLGDLSFLPPRAAIAPPAISMILVDVDGDGCLELVLGTEDGVEVRGDPTR